MLEKGAVCRSTSQWASPIVLVCKKDGALGFCIDLQKFNNKMIKDVQSLPRIEASLGCLDGETIFTSLHLQSGYWQVELTEASWPLTAFTIEPLRFYECVWMPFGNQCTSHIPMPDAVMLRGYAPQMVYNLFR